MNLPLTKLIWISFFKRTLSKYKITFLLLVLLLTLPKLAYAEVPLPETQYEVHLYENGNEITDSSTFVNHSVCSEGICKFSINHTTDVTFYRVSENVLTYEQWWEQELLSIEECRGAVLRKGEFDEAYKSFFNTDYYKNYLKLKLQYQKSGQSEMFVRLFEESKVKHREYLHDLGFTFFDNPKCEKSTDKYFLYLDMLKGESSKHYTSEYEFKGEVIVKANYDLKRKKYKIISIDNLYQNQSTKPTTTSPLLIVPLILVTSIVVVLFLNFKKRKIKRSR